MIGLTLGGFDLVNDGLADYTVDAKSVGTDWGNPEPIEVVISSLLMDGSVVVTQGYDNRTVMIRVEISSSDLASVAEGEAALFAEIGGQNTLTYTPPDGFGAVTVFGVVTSSFEHAMDDFSETEARRFYVIRLVCEPFSRSASEVVTAALPASGTTTTLVDAGSSTTNWTGAVNATVTAPSVVSGAVKVTSGSIAGQVTVTATRTASITTSATPYLVIDWKPESAFGKPTLRAYGDGVELSRLAQAVSPTAGFTRTWFNVPAASVAVLRLSSTTDGRLVNGSAGSPFVRSLAIDNIDRTDVRPTLGTARQLLRTIEVEGSARSQCALAVEHETNSLGDALVYVWPDVEGYAPNAPSLRQHRVSGGTVTSDSALVSGAREPLNATTVTWDIPLASVIPSLHLFAVRISSVSGTILAGNLTWTVSTRVNGTTVGNVETRTTAVTTVANYGIFTIGRTLLPNVDVDPAAASAYVRVTLTADAAFLLDEGWMFSSVGQIVGPVSCGSGTAAAGGPARRLFILPPTIDRPRPTVRIGHSSDRSDSFFPTGLGGWQFPEFKPPRVNVFTVTTNALDAAVSLRHFPRWHTHAAS